MADRQTSDPSIDSLNQMSNKVLRYMRLFCLQYDYSIFPEVHSPVFRSQTPDMLNVF